MWLIEENAIILRKDVWLIPPRAPTIAERILEIINIQIILNGEIK